MNIFFLRNWKKNKKFAVKYLFVLNKLVDLIPLCFSPHICLSLHHYLLWHGSQLRPDEGIANLQNINIIYPSANSIKIKILGSMSSLSPKSQTLWVHGSSPNEFKNVQIKVLTRTMDLGWLYNSVVTIDTGSVTMDTFNSSTKDTDSMQ